MTFFTILGFIFAGIISVFVIYILFLVLRQIAHSHKEIVKAINSWDGKHDVVAEFTNYDGDYIITLHLFNDWFVKHTAAHMYRQLMWFCVQKFV